MKTEHEINELIRQWERDPIWDLEDAEGFEVHREMLKQHRLKKQAQWHEKRQRSLSAEQKSLRDYFAAHAPGPPQPWFIPVMETKRPESSGPLSPSGYAPNYEEIEAWDAEFRKQRYIQWPYAWADAMLAEREKPGVAGW